MRNFCNFSLLCCGFSQRQVSQRRCTDPKGSREHRAVFCPAPAYLEAAHRPAPDPPHQETQEPMTHCCPLRRRGQTRPPVTASAAWTPTGCRVCEKFVGRQASTIHALTRAATRSGEDTVAVGPWIRMKANKYDARPWMPGLGAFPCKTTRNWTTQHQPSVWQSGAVKNEKDVDRCRAAVACL